MMFVPPALPYYKESSLLPAPLPSTDEIVASTRVLGERLRQRVVLVGQHFVVKYGTATREREGHNLIFLEQNSTFFAPKLYAMYRHGGELFIIMEFMPGQTLQAIWPSLQDLDKTRIMQSLRKSLEQMRAIPSPVPHFYGSVARDIVPHHLFWTPDSKPANSGPFADEGAFNMGLVNQLQDIWLHNEKHSFRADFFAKHLGCTLRNHAPTFSHSDIQRKNIIVQGLDKTSGTLTKDFRVSVVDWEDSGWYPTYWEYFAAFTAFKWRDDWPSKLELAIDAWPTETATVHMIYHDLFF